MHGVFLSVVLIFNYPGGGQTIEQFGYQFTGPTAIEYCQNAQGRLKNKNTGDQIMVVQARCISD
jgi:hypothetical protein